jgi:uncharacterized membrane protein YidH (DUF202 family)
MKTRGWNAFVVAISLAWLNAGVALAQWAPQLVSPSPSQNYTFAKEGGSALMAIVVIAFFVVLAFGIVRHKAHQS